MSHVILVTGGARSGKSRFAETLCQGFGQPLLYVATATSTDPEMEERIRIHQNRRGPSWQTVEAPLDVEPHLLSPPDGTSGILLDCLTLWITNLLFSGDQSPGPVLERVRSLTTLFPRVPVPLVIVTNEVGMGIVPETPLGRLFRDLAGEANRLVAQAASEVHLVVSGIPLRLR